jgi:serine/threonine-protein kinase HipA
MAAGKTHRLAFALYGRRAGLIERIGGRITLTYDALYAEDRTSTPLSLSLPLAGGSHGTRPVEAYLRGLLPDHDEVRRRWVQEFGLRDRDTVSLIAAIGGDCAGGAVFAEEERLDDTLSKKGGIRPVSEKTIGDHLRTLRLDEAAWHGENNDHWSLAGGQSKFTLVRRGKGWGVASGAEPSTHIVKPGISAIPAQAMTEHVSMRALELMGERVARSGYAEFDGEPAIVVERFDRTQDAKGRMARVHSEDLVQSFGLDPARKYEADGGPGVARIAALLRAVADEDSVTRFARAVIGNYLLGAPDAHAKNYSVLLAQRSVTLAPLYDVASGLAGDSPGGLIRYRSVAMSIGGKRLIGDVGAREWERFAVACGIPAETIRVMMDEMARIIPDAMRDAIAELPPGVAGRDILEDRVLPRVAKLAAHTIKGLSAPPRSGNRSASSFLDTL